MIALVRGKDIGQGGAHYNSVGCVGLGLANAADSLLAIKQAVYEEKRLTMTQLLEALRGDFAGQEPLRQYLLNRIPKWGNGVAEADELARRVADDYCDRIHTFTNGRGGVFQAALFSLTHRVAYGAATGALPDGRRARESLSAGVGAMTAADKNGATGLINSITKLDFLQDAEWLRARHHVAPQRRRRGGRVGGVCRPDQDLFRAGRLCRAIQRLSRWTPCARRKSTRSAMPTCKFASPAGASIGTRSQRKSKITLSRGASMASESGAIFDIKRFAVHDGPGIRTVVFLKGCPLRCVWCHNPEGIQMRAELIWYENKCVACGACFTACPQGAHEMIPGDPPQRVYHRERCQQCGRCVETCYAEALTLTGKTMTVGEVMAPIRQDVAFYAQSGGGVTLSGGEPLLQAEFAVALLRQCKQEGFHTALDTCGYAPWSAFESALPYVDMLLYDLKHADPESHRRYTGRSNQRILANLRRLAARGLPIEIRMPIIPGVNDAREAIEPTAQLLAGLENITAVRLLSYHSLAGSKYARLGMANTLPSVEPPSAERLQQIAGWIRERGVRVII